jgi:L-aminopeptidase/D-esterase-like protein
MRKSRQLVPPGVGMTAVLVFAAALVGGGQAAPDLAKGLTAVQGVKVGHHTLSERPTGCTVILTESGAVGGVDVRGGAPGTSETDLLSPVASSPKVHGIVLSGGSAFGLDARSGVLRYLEERNIGQVTHAGRVPIVPAAILFDLGIGDWKIRPGPDCGYRAAQAATDGAVSEGSVGAGAGATVGKLGGPKRAMKGGVGTSAISMPNGLIVAAIVAVNAVGDVIDPSTGQVVAGVRTADGKALADARKLLRSGELSRPRSGENTTIGVIATNATLNKAQAQKVAQMAHDGFARAITPAHTGADGDTIFTLATGGLSGEAEVTLVGALAADAMAEAIVRAVRGATGLADYPSVRDLGHRPPGSR